MPGYTKLIGSGSIYTLTPCTREAALEALEQAQHRPLMVVALGPERALPATDGADQGGDTEDDDIDDDDIDDDDGEIDLP